MHGVLSAQLSAVRSGTIRLRSTLPVCGGAIVLRPAVLQPGTTTVLRGASLRSVWEQPLCTAGIRRAGLSRPSRFATHDAARNGDDAAGDGTRADVADAHGTHADDAASNGRPWTAPRDAGSINRSEIAIDQDGLALRKSTLSDF